MKHVYFMKPIGMSGPIKIGCSVMPMRRLQTLDVWSPFPLELIAAAEGANCHERALHFMFREHLCHGEWFASTPELERLIAQVKMTGKLPELPRVPYATAAKTRDRNPNRDPRQRIAKCAVTRRIRSAEIHAWGPWRSEKRPQWIKEAIASWQGAFTPPPTGELLYRIEAYVADLRSRPKETRTWFDWREERLVRESRAA
jgi:hypothetical protein